MREAETLSRLSHDGITRLQAWFDHPDGVYLALEYAAGGELFDRLCARGPYPEALGAELALNLLGAVAYLHDRGLMHRDIKVSHATSYHVPATS